MTYVKVTDEPSVRKLSEGSLSITTSVCRRASVRLVLEPYRNGKRRSSKPLVMSKCVKNVSSNGYVVYGVEDIEGRLLNIETSGLKFSVNKD